MTNATMYKLLFGKESVQTIVEQANAQVHAIAARKVSQLKTVRRNGCTETVLYPSVNLEKTIKLSNAPTKT